MNALGPIGTRSRYMQARETAIPATHTMITIPRAEAKSTRLGEHSRRRLPVRHADRRGVPAAVHGV